MNENQLRGEGEIVMNRSYPLVEIHYAFWAVLSVPLGFAGLFFVFPGLNFTIGVPLLAISGLLIYYIAHLTRMSRVAWLAGVAGHGALLLAAAYYVPRWPLLLGVPLAAANLYSVLVLLVRRRLWMSGGERRGVMGPVTAP